MCGLWNHSNAAPRYLRDAHPSVAFLFIGDRNSFPFAHVWQAFLAAAPTPFTYSVHIALDKPDKLPETDLASLLAVGAHVVPSNSIETRGAGGATKADAAIHLLQTVLRDQPYAERFCLLPTLSLPIFNFTEVYWALLNDARSSVSCSAAEGRRLKMGGSATSRRRMATSGLGKTPGNKDRGSTSADDGLWSVLTRSHAKIVAERGPAVYRDLRAGCAAGNECHATAQLLPTVLLAKHNASGDMSATDAIECNGAVVSQTRVTKVMSPAMMARLRKPCHQNDKVQYCLNCRACPRFVQHSAPGAATAILRFMCSDAAPYFDPAVPGDASPDAVAVMNSAPCRRHAIKAWRKLPTDYLPMLEAVRRSAAAQLTTQKVAKAAWADLDAIRNASSTASEHVTSTATTTASVDGRPARRLLFAFTFWLPKWPKAIESLGKWSSAGTPCSGRYAASSSLLLAPGIETTTDADTLLQRAKENFEPALAQVRRCFKTIGWYDKCRFTDDQAKYPLSAGLQFFQMLGDAELRAAYDVVWLMEPDIFPLRPYWLDALYVEAREPAAFMVKGTLHRGLPGFEKSGADIGAEPTSMLEDVSWALRAQEWLLHMNGAAFYSLGDPVLDEALRAAKALQLVNTGTPFDVLLYLVFADAAGQTSVRAPSTKPLDVFPLRQYLSTRLVYTDYVWNVGGQAGRKVVRESAHAAGAYLMHGQDGFTAMRDAHHAIMLDESHPLHPKNRMNKTRARSFRGCPFMCGARQGRGECKDGRCVCAAGWMGISCGNRVSRGDDQL